MTTVKEVHLNRMMWHLAALILTLGGVEGWVNQYDEPFTWSCPAGQFISAISSIHNNHHEDRLYDFTCSSPPVRGSATHCHWSDYANEFDQPLNYQCPGQGFVVGIGSYHDNRYEDRRFRFQCCEIPKTTVHSCRTTSWENDWDGPIAFSVPTGKILRGVYSVHDNNKEDRRHQFTICRISNLL